MLNGVLKDRMDFEGFVIGDWQAIDQIPGDWQGQPGEIDAPVASWLPVTEGDGVADVLYGHRPFTGQLPSPGPSRGHSSRSTSATGRTTRSSRTTGD
jgi:hypothetical protein